MEIYDVLTLIGGLCLFLFGMNLMGEALERAAGNSLRTLLGKLTGNRFLGFLTGLAVTAVIQSSSATTVMVVGFVNSSLLTLKQAIGVIMGANVGTTVTAWILSLGGINGDTLLLQLLKPTNFTPILALVGIILYMFLKGNKKKDTGMILLGFAVLMFGMDTMSGAVTCLKDEPWFTNMFLLFKNPILGVLAGAILTGIIQSSSASVGILQALSATGAVSYGASIPIIMGQNIGTTVTALLSSVGTNKNARRAAIVHMMFNVIGTVMCLAIYILIDWIFSPAILDAPTDYVGISVCHSAFNIICTAILLPCGGLLEKLVCFLVPDNQDPEQIVELDERLMDVPAVALQRCREVANEMADCAAKTFHDGAAVLDHFCAELANTIRQGERRTDYYEDILGSYLVKLSSHQLTADDNTEAAMLLKVIGDYERISDHGRNLLESAEEMQEKKLTLSPAGQQELAVLMQAVSEIVELSFRAFRENDLSAAYRVEPLEEVIDSLKETMRTNHTLRLQQGTCSISTGFVWADLLTNLERVGDHCSNIAGCVIDLHCHDLNTHRVMRSAKKQNADFERQFAEYAAKYTLN